MLIIHIFLQIKVHLEYESSPWVNSSSKALLPPTGCRKCSTFNCSCMGSCLQDTGISVRKRVIKILRDICLEQPTFNKITEMCVKMIRRVNDEEGIKVNVATTYLPKCDIILFLSPPPPQTVHARVLGWMYGC